MEPRPGSVRHSALRWRPVPIPQRFLAPHACVGRRSRCQAFCAPHGARAPAACRRQDSGEAAEPGLAPGRPAAPPAGAGGAASLPSRQDLRSHGDTRDSQTSLHPWPEQSGRATQPPVSPLRNGVAAGPGSRCCGALLTETPRLPLAEACHPRSARRSSSWRKAGGSVAPQGPSPARHSPPSISSRGHGPGRRDVLRERERERAHSRHCCYSISLELF